VPEDAAAVSVAAEREAQIAAPDTTGGQLMGAEDRAEGAVGGRVYVDYGLAMGGPMLACTLVALVACTVGSVGSDLWLSYWSSTATGSGLSIGYFVGCYAAVNVGTAVLYFLQTLATAQGTMLASLRLHAAMLVSVMRSPMAFFDATPLGRIINRFSADMAAVDMALPSALANFANILLRTLATLVVQAIVFPLSLIAIVPMMFVYIYIQQYFRRSSRELKRLDAITKSPMYSLLTETLAGLTTVKAYGLSPAFIRRCQLYTDINTNVFIKTNLVTCWL